MDKKNDAVQGKPDAVETRAAEIAQRDGNSEISDEDRERAYKELSEMGAPASKPTP